MHRTNTWNNSAGASHMQMSERHDKLTKGERERLRMLHYERGYDVQRLARIFGCSPRQVRRAL